MMELFRGGIWMLIADAVLHELAGEFGEFEGFFEALGGGQGAEDLEEAAMIGAGFDVHE